MNGLALGSLASADADEGRSMVASGPGADSALGGDSMVGCAALGVALQLPPVGPKGEMGDAAG
jgi:hypothetical protein